MNPNTSADIYGTMFEDYPDVVDIKQLSQMLNLTPKTCYKILNNKTIPSRKLGREYRISKYAVIHYLNNGTDKNNC